MAEKKTETKTEQAKEYIIPLRNEWRKGANYKRAGRAIKAIKKFILRHMKIRDGDINKVKLDQWLNQEIWFRGKTKPPAKIKVKAIKEGEIVRVELAELPQFVKFEKVKAERRHKPAAKPEVTPATSKEEKEERSEEKTEEQKKDEKEKEQSVADVREKQAKQTAKAQKSAGAQTKTPGHHRKALKK